MKNIMLKGFIVFGLLLMLTKAFCQGGDDSASVVGTLNKIFVIDRTGAVGGQQQATIDKKIDMYVKNFYSLYAIDQGFIDSKLKKINDATNINDSVADLLNIKEKAKQGVKKLLGQEVYYATQKNMEDKIKDNLALVLMPAEGGANNINPNTQTDDNVTIKQMAAGGSPYGSLDDANKPTGQNVKDILDVNVLVGPDGYSVKDKEAENAKLFINQLIQSSPPPKSFYLPAADKSGSVSVYLPYADKTNNTPYTKVKVSTKPQDGKNSEYADMVDMLNKSSLYREYKMKVRSKLALRALVLDNIFRAFQERYKATDKDKSLVEKEKDMALVGLTQEYYNNLKTKSVADVNLETIYALNKVVYFLHKLHQDNERTQLVMSIYGMQAQLQDSNDEAQYIKPISELIENKCWDLSISDVPSGKTQEERREICPK